MKRREEKKQINKLFYNRMKELGFEDITSFARSSTVDISFETIRRAIHDNRHDIRYEYIVALMQSLDFTAEEIANELRARGDEHLHKLVSASAKGIMLSDQESTIITTMRKHKKLIPIMVSLCDLVK